MKVLQILPELDSGGVETCTLQLAQHLAATGHDSLVVSNGGALVDDLASSGARHIRIPVHRKHPASLLQVKKLRALFEKECPDIVHARSRVPDWLAYLAWKRMPDGSRPRFVTTVHGQHSVGFPNSLYTGIVTQGERVICVSESTRDYVFRHFPKTDPAKVEVIYDGIDTSKWPRDYHPSADWLAKWYAEFPQTRGKIMLTLPGRLTALKGHSDFLDVLAVMPEDTVGLIVGHCPASQQRYRSDLMTKAAHLGLSERVIYTGARHDLREIYALSRLVFSLSQKPESFGLTTVEALTMGRPVVGYAFGGVRETLDHLFPAGKVIERHPAIAAEVAETLLASPNLQPAINDRFDLAVTLTQTVDLYKSLLDS